MTDNKCTRCKTEMTESSLACGKAICPVCHDQEVLVAEDVTYWLSFPTPPTKEP